MLFTRSRSYSVYKVSDEVVEGNSGGTRVVIGDWCTEMKYSLHILAAVLYLSLFNKTLFVFKQVHIWVHSVVSMQCKYVSSESITNNDLYRQGKTDQLRERLVPISICPPQISRGLTQDWTWVWAARGWWMNDLSEVYINIQPVAHREHYVLPFERQTSRCHIGQ